MTMSILDALLGRAPALEEAEEELGNPDDAEAEDLKLHVLRCSLRWKMSYRASKENSAQLAQLRLIMLVGAIVLAITQPPIAKWIGEHLL